jgi:multicomponent Na+:H+ antiporter subunit D
VSALVVLPILVPLLAGMVCMVVPRVSRVRQAVALAAATGLLVSSVALLVRVWRDGVQVLQPGGWEAPLGISLVADLTASLLVGVAGVVGWATVLFSFRTIQRPMQAGLYYPLVLVLLSAVCGAFLTGDIFNLFVWFEVMLIASFSLVILRGGRAALEGATKYMVMSLLGSALLLTAIALVYGVAGTLNMADLSVRLAAAPAGAPLTAIGMVFLLAFGIKAAAFPLFSWLPASYPVLPTALSSLYSALLTKVGVYSILRVFTLLFVHDPELTRSLLLGVGVLTMVTGVLGAVAQVDIRRLLSFHIISQIGYLIAGVGLGDAAALAATLVFIVHVSFAKAALFLVAGLARRSTGTFNLDAMGGLYRREPLLSFLFLVPALSLAGLPPFSGFIAKYAIVRAALLQEAWWVAVAGGGVGLLTLYSMIKIWRKGFWEEPPEGTPERKRLPARRWTMLVACALLGAPSLVLGLGAEPLLRASDAAAAQLLSPQGYVGKVLED